MRMRYPVLLLLASILIGTVSIATAAVSLVETPTPSYDPALMSEGPLGSVPGALTPPLIGAAIECFNFTDNAAYNSGYVFIPPDPIDAAGFAHVMNVGNDYVEWRLKAAPADTPQFRTGLLTFFTGTPDMLAGVNPFDPKVIYDQYADRFIVVSLQVATSPALSSRILVAVSKTSDPNLGWWLHSINSTLTIGGLARWADYPGLGVDDDALYVCANMFNAAGTSYGGSRLWIIQKAPTYAGPNGSISQAVYDAYAAVGFPSLATTTQATHMKGAPMAEPANVGTFLVSYSGLSDGTNEYIDIIRVDNATGVPVFNFQQLLVGNIDNTASAFASAPQLGSARLIRTNDRRALTAVWRGGSLYMCATLYPNATIPGIGADANQTTGHWWRVDTSNLAALSVADQGNVGAEDLGASTWVYFPAVDVDLCGNMAIGFSASSTTMYAGAYYASRLLGDPAGTIGNSQVLAAGTDWYVRTFSSSLTAPSRWGDYSGISVCPVDNTTFWVYNEYACTRGTPTSVGGVVEDGRWCTKLGQFSMCQPVSVAISSFTASADGDVVSLRGEFRSNLQLDAVNVYRGGETGSMVRIATVGAEGTSFEYTDQVGPGATYRYQIGVVDADGEFMSPIATVKVKELGIALAQNHPNPFNPETTIHYTVPDKGHVSLNVYDANGRLIRSLVDEVSGPGSHDVRWDGRDNHGAVVGSGVYFYRLTAGKYSESKKMVLLK